MPVPTQKASTPNKPALRRRATVLAAGMGVSLALGSGVALATSAASAPQGDAFALQTADSLSRAVSLQVEGQNKAATKEQAKADSKKRAATGAAADRKKRQALKPAAWVKPVDKYTKGSTFGLGGKMWSSKHSGQDLVAPTGTPVKSVRAGTVIEAGWGGSYGNNIVIRHADRTFTQYGHLSKIEVRAGQTLKTGQKIGKVGSTGNSTGPHLHFETRTAPVYGSAIEPLKFMRSQGVAL